MQGNTAPLFTLPDSDNNQVSLSDQKGRNVVLLFFPKAFTNVCTAELCSVRDDHSAYENLNAQVFGISTDPVETLAQFKTEHSYPFPLLSDQSTEVSNAYQSLYPAGVSKRSAFVIDKEGVIRHAEILEDGYQQPDFNAIKTALGALS